jgi:hypothetical protein
MALGMGYSENLSKENYNYQPYKDPSSILK